MLHSYCFKIPLAKQGDKRYTVSEVIQVLDEKDLQAIAQLMEQQEKRIMNGVQAIIESDVKKDIKTLAEGHAQILERLPEAEEQAELKSRVRILERVVVDLRKEVEDLKKAT